MVISNKRNFKLIQKKELDNEKDVPFDIIIDMSSLYDYKIDNGKIISEKVDINFKEIFPDSYVIKIDDFFTKLIELYCVYMI